MRGIREYADVLYPEVTIINDDLDTWKQDCSAVLEEAKWNNPNKKIFACIMTNYFNKTLFYYFTRYLSILFQFIQ